MLGFLFNLGPDASHKQDEFSKALLEKGLKFVPSSGDGTIALNLDFLLLSLKVGLILEEQSCKNDTLIAYSTSYVKIVFRLSIEVKALHIKVFIVQVDVFDLKKVITEYKIYLTIFLTLDKQF